MQRIDVTFQQKSFSLGGDLDQGHRDYISFIFVTMDPGRPTNEILIKRRGIFARERLSFLTRKFIRINYAAVWENRGRGTRKVG